MLEARAFEPEFLHKLDGLVLATRRARTHRAGQRTIGRHQGGGIEPEGFREYTPGDDLRRLDWRVYARSDRHYIKQYEDESNVRVTFDTPHCY